MNCPGQWPWRVIRGTALALVCCGLPLYGHHIVGQADRDAVIGFVVLVVAIVGVRLAARQVSFVCLTGTLATSSTTT